MKNTTNIKNEVKVNDTVKFQFGRNKKTTLSGRVVSSSFKFVYVETERVSGRFAKESQKNVLCINKNQLL